MQENSQKINPELFSETLEPTDKPEGIKERRGVKSSLNIGKAMVMIWGGFFIIVLILVGLFFTYWYYQKDKLVRLVPEDASFYVRVHKNFWPWLEFPIGDLENIFKEVEKAFGWQDISWQEDIVPLIKQDFALAGLPNQDKSGIDLILILPLKDKEEAKDLLPHLNHYNFFNKKLVIATSKDALQKVIQVKEQKTPSLKGQVTKKFFADDFLRVYLKSAEIFQLLNGPDNLTGLNQAERLDLFLNKSHTFPWSIRSLRKDSNYPSSPQEAVRYSGKVWDKKRDFWSFEIWTNLVSKQSVYSASADFITHLPNEYLFFIKNLNLKEILDNWQRTDKIFSDLFEQKIKEYERIYNFSWSDDILPLINNQAELLIVAEKDLQSKNINYLATFVLKDVSQVNLDKLESLAKKVLAQKLPQEREKTLPDGTKVMELIAQPDIFNFKTVTLAQGGTIHYLNEPEVNFNFSYLLKDNQIIVSNSFSDFLALLWQQENLPINTKSLAKRCWGKELDKFILLNTSNFLKYLPDGLRQYFKYIPGQTIIISTDNSTISGCIY